MQQKKTKTKKKKKKKKQTTTTTTKQLTSLLKVGLSLFSCFVGSNLIYCYVTYVNI